MTINKTTTDLSTLKINYLTQEMYEDALENEEINENELYITPNTTTIPTKTSDLINDSGFVTTDEKLKTPVIGEDVGYRYFVLTATSDSAETKIRSTGALRYSLDEDSTLEIGTAYIPSKLVLHSGKGYSANTTIVSNEVISSATITLPIVSGTVALTSDIPSKTSELTNDSGFITSSNIPVTDVEVKGTSIVSSGVATVSLSNLGVHTSTTAPTASDGDDGDIWFVYTT